MTSTKDDSVQTTKTDIKKKGHKTKEGRETPGIETAYRPRKFVQCIHLKKILPRQGMMVHNF